MMVVDDVEVTVDLEKVWEIIDSIEKAIDFPEIADREKALKIAAEFLKNLK